MDVLILGIHESIDSKNEKNQVCFRQINLRKCRGILYPFIDKKTINL